MLAEDDDGPLHVRVLGRDEADAQFMAKLWRFLLYKDGGPTLHLTRLEDVEHEAYTLLLADAPASASPPSSSRERPGRAPRSSWSDRPTGRGSPTPTRPT